MRTSITPEGRFCYGIHKPSYCVRNLRCKTKIDQLGKNQTGGVVKNNRNFPDGPVDVPGADWIYEIANPFPFRGVTFIGKSWAERNAGAIDAISLPTRPLVSLSTTLAAHNVDPELMRALPRPLLLSLAVNSTDPDDLTVLAQLSCSFENDGAALGLRFHRDSEGKERPEINDEELFEAVANNPALPDSYKIAMVIRPGAQGASEIVGDYRGSGHIYEYLRRNSYIAGGHYAANMADDAIRYDIDSLSHDDMQGLRHLYYQRTFVRLADLLGIEFPTGTLTRDDLEELRISIAHHPDLTTLPCKGTLWGWNFGFDFSSSGYRLHASHQQIHQQYSLVPSEIAACCDGKDTTGKPYNPFSAGDLLEEVITTYRDVYKSDFFNDYLRAMRTNKRMDNRDDRHQSLIVWQDTRVMLFVPKAQTSQWELQIMTLPDEDGSWPGNIIETDLQTRQSLDHALLKAQQALAGRGARMVTSIEFSKRFSSTATTQPLIYSLMPKIPQSPGSFSETQLRFITGHYPEDFAAACRLSLQSR